MADDVVISERSGAALASLIARRGKLAPLRDAVRDTWGADLPLTPRIVEGTDASFIWAGPERWLVMTDVLAPDALVTLLRTRVHGLGAVCDQSDSRVLLRLSGSFARDALAKGIPVDLHPSVFTPGTTAITAAAYIGCQIWQIDGTPTYEIAIPTSFAASFRHWLEMACIGERSERSPPLGAERAG